MLDSVKLQQRAREVHGLCGALARKPRRKSQSVDGSLFRSIPGFLTRKPKGLDWRSTEGGMEKPPSVSLLENLWL